LIKRRQIKRRPHKLKKALLIPLFLLLIVLAAGWWTWSYLSNTSNPQFNYLKISRNSETIKVLNGESIILSPRDRIKILDTSTNLFLDRGITLFTSTLDVNILLYKEVVLADLLPNKDIFKRYVFTLDVNLGNQKIGYIDMVIEPGLSDWLNKANRAIGSKRKTLVLEDALQLYPDNMDIKKRLLNEYRGQKKWQEAALILEETARQNPGIDVYEELIEIYKALGQEDLIIATQKRLIELDPENSELRFQLATLLEEAGKSRDAIVEYEALLKVTSQQDALPLYLTLGYLYNTTKQYEKAITSYLKALELNKKDVNLYHNISYLYEKIGQQKKADEYLEKAVEINSGDTKSLLELADRLIEQESLTKADKYLDKALDSDPRSITALLLKVKIAEKRKDQSAIKGLYKRILAIDPHKMTLVYNLGVMEYNDGNFSDALPYMDRYARYYPSKINGHEFLFEIYKKLKIDDLAYKEAQTLSNLKPGEISYYSYMFEYLNSRQKYAEIITVMKKGLNVNSRSITLRKYLILTYLNSGKDDFAIDEINEILKVNPEDISLMLQLARLYEKQVKYGESAGIYKKILAVSPDHKEAKEAYPASLMKYTGQLERRGEYQEALDICKQVMDISPGHKEAEDAYLRLKIKVLSNSTGK
jgi:tetratricopeptide (TPR) repeat protein